MGFKINFDAEKVSTGFGLVKEGKYEVAIVRAELKEWQGQYSIGFDVEIRSDVEQEHQGAKVLYNTLYLTSANPDYAEDTEKKRNSFFVACGYTGKSEIDVEQAVKDIIGKNVLAYVKHRENKDGKVFPEVRFVAKSAASKQNYTRTSEDPFANNKGPIEVKEDDLPF